MLTTPPKNLPFMKIPEQVQMLPVVQGHPFFESLGEVKLFTPYEDPATVKSGPMAMRGEPLFLRIGSRSFSREQIANDLFGNHTVDPRSRAEFSRRKLRAAQNPFDRRDVDAMFAVSFDGYEAVNGILVALGNKINILGHFFENDISPEDEISDPARILYESMLLCDKFCRSLKIEMSQREYIACSKALNSALKTIQETGTDQTIPQMIFGPIQIMLTGLLLSRRLPQVYWWPTSVEDIETVNYDNLGSQLPFGVVPLLRGIFSTSSDITIRLMQAYGMADKRTR